jgi:hypothetical protein
MIAQQLKFTASRTSVDQTMLPSSEDAETPVQRSRELNWPSLEQIQLPVDHCASESCSCSFCATQVKQSEVPVLTRAEYELAELQSQCDGKDQHITELLRTVQSLQGQVNILNAKLLFLHDHHTTRPMRRRTLARDNHPVRPSIPVYSSRLNPALHQRTVDEEHSRGFWVSTTENHNGTAAVDSSPLSTLDLPEAFSGGIPTRNNADVHLNVHTMLQQPYDSEIPATEEDEFISFLTHDNNRFPPPFSLQLIHTNQHTQVDRSPPLNTIVNATARGDHAAHFGRGSKNLREERYETEIERVLRDMDEEEPECDGEDMLDQHYYMDAYKTMDQQLYRRPALPLPMAPRPMAIESYKKHLRMSLPIHNLIAKRISLANSFRWRERTPGV